MARLHAQVANYTTELGGGVVAHDRLPSVKKLAAEINQVRTQGKNSVRKSADYLHANAAQLAKYGSAEDLVAAEIEGDGAARAGVFHSARSGPSWPANCGRDGPSWDPRPWTVSFTWR